MEHLIADEKRKKGIEYVVLIVFSFYNMIFSYEGYNLGWNFLSILIVVLCLFFSWLLTLLKYRTYPVRALFITMLMQVCLLLYEFNSPNYMDTIPTLFVFCILVAMYGLPDVIILSDIVQFILIVSFLVNGKEKLGEEAFQKSLPQIGNIFFCLVLVFCWVIIKNQTTNATNQMIRDMEKAERSKDDFLANISHEIRTPLNTIYGMSEMAKKQTDLNLIKEEIYNIEVASRNLMSMVNDILDFSELQSGEIDLEEETYNISSTITDIVNMTMAAVESKGLDVVVDFAPDMPSLLEGDEKKIRRIILNLVNNAVKFTQEGFIGIKVSCRKESYGINVMVEVSDTGIGMKDDYMEKLFTEFGQLDTRRNRAEGGVGLGLAISSLLAQKLGGVITVNSKKGVGSTFTLVVPQKVVEEEPAVTLHSNEKIKVLCYVDFEKLSCPESRDANMAQMIGIINALDLDWVYCRNLEEFRRRTQNEKYTHVYISKEEYDEDRQFFNLLAQRAKLIIEVARGSFVGDVTEDALVLYKPVYSLTLAAALNQEYDGKYLETAVKDRKFTAPKAHILVVDDNMMNIRVIENILEQFKIQVSRALSGHEALEKVESMDYDFIFMDHMMPEMDGVETFHRIREKSGSYYQKVPIIALTANAVAGSRKMFMDEGFSDFLEKPVELSVLERVLRRNIPADKIVYVDEDVPMEEEIHVMEEVQVHSIDQIVGLNIEEGKKYCGGERGYRMILAECVKGAMENAENLQKLFITKDWKNYIIKIHALKGTMKSIGATELSDRAKELEFAGKEERYSVIEEKHKMVVTDYLLLMEQVALAEKVPVSIRIDFESIVTITKDEEVQKATDRAIGVELTAEQFKVAYERFENAMYELNLDEMNKVVSELCAYTFGGKMRSAEFEKINRKIDQADYFSAGSDLEELGKLLS